MPVWAAAGCWAPIMAAADNTTSEVVPSTRSANDFVFMITFPVFVA
jgi:hypothetical protein